MLDMSKKILSSLSAIYSQNILETEQIFTRIATGKKKLVPSDDLAWYHKAVELESDICLYEVIKTNLMLAKGFSSAIIDIGDYIVDALFEMESIADAYAATTDIDEQIAYNAEFEAKGSTIMNIINNTMYDDIKLVQSGTINSIQINPDDRSDTIDFVFASSDIISDVSATVWDLDGSGGAAKSSSDVQVEKAKAYSYLVKARSVSTQVDRQISYAETISRNKVLAQSVIVNIDEAREISRAVDAMLRNQSALAMIAQANLLPANIHVLYGDTMDAGYNFNEGIKV